MADSRTARADAAREAEPRSGVQISCPEGCGHIWADGTYGKHICPQCKTLVAIRASHAGIISITVVDTPRTYFPPPSKHIDGTPSAFLADGPATLIDGDGDGYDDRKVSHPSTMRDDARPTTNICLLCGVPIQYILSYPAQVSDGFRPLTSTYLDPLTSLETQVTKWIPTLKNGRVCTPCVPALDTITSIREDGTEVRRGKLLVEQKNTMREGTRTVPESMLNVKPDYFIPKKIDPGFVSDKEADVMNTPLTVADLRANRLAAARGLTHRIGFHTLSDLEGWH